MQSKNKTLTSICSQIDLFAQQVQLRINKSPKFYTPLGLCMSLILITLSLVLAINNIIDVVKKSSPSVVSSEQQNQETPNFLFHPNNFTFVVSINKLTLENIYGLDTLFTLKFTSCFRKRDPITKIISQECTIYDMNHCEDKNFEADFQKKYFEQFNKSNIYCINYDQWIEKPFSIQGAAASNEFKYVKFDLMICKNSTSKQTCLSEQEIKQQFPGGLIVYYIQDQLVDLKKSESFFTPAIRQGSAIFTFDKQKTIIGFQKTVYVQTDVGLFVQDLVETSTYQNYLEKESSDSLGSQIFMEYVFQLDPRQIYYNRAYDKIQDIVGTIGGLWQALYFLISILILPFVERLLELSLINKFFTFSYKTQALHDVDSISLNRSKNYLTSPPLSKTSTKKQIILKPQIEKVSSPNQIAQYLKERKNQLRLNISDLCSFLFFSKRKEKRQFEYSQNKIQQKLDITFILNRLFEIDKLKMVLLNDRQLKLFNYFPKPCLSDALFSKDKWCLRQEDQIEFSYLLSEELTQEEKVQEAFKAYKELKQSKLQEPLDKRILNYFDQDLKNLFDALVDIELAADSCIEYPESIIPNDQQNDDSNYQNIYSTYQTHMKPQLAQSK